MTNARAWPVRAMYILIAAALAIGLFITAAPAQNVSAQASEVKAEWEMTDTPTIANWVLAPESVIYDYALASEGTVAYAVVWAGPDTCDTEEGWDYRLLKSTDGAATWSDLTVNLENVLDTDAGDDITTLLLVTTDWIDPDFVAVALVYFDFSANASVLSVFFSTDGGSTFNDAGEVVDEGVYLGVVSDLVVSLPISGVRDMAIGGADTGGNGVVFRSTVTGETASEWQNASMYEGWDDGIPASDMVTDLIFSPNWPADRTILAVTYGPTASGPGPFDVYLQSGTWGKTEASSAWNAAAGFANPVPVKAGVSLPTFFAFAFNARAIAGVALPNDYNGSDSTTRWAWVWVNYYTFPAGVETGEILMISDGLATSINQQIPGMPWLTNVSYLGTIAQGKAIAGVLGNGAGDFVDSCAGIRIYNNSTIVNMNICCIPWEPACKLPTGMAGMAVSYVDANNAGNGKPDKAYAVALFADPEYDLDESAWSVSVDGDGLVWNQLSLVDTEIDYFSDVAVSPDCNKMMLVSVNTNTDTSLGCDSVWLKATSLPEDEEYSGFWIRTWLGELTDTTANRDDFPYDSERGLLRLPPASVETTGDTVYLVDRGTNIVYYNDLETWNCWTKGTSSIDEIADLAVLDEATIYALGENGDVAMSNDHGKTVSWTDPVESELDYGWTIAVHGNNVTDVLVGGQDADVSYSDDGGATFTALKDVIDVSAYVTVAFDTYFDTNHVVYAALAHAYEENGIYMTTVPDNTEWTNLGAEPFNYTGLVLSYLGGNTFTSAQTGGVLYASYFTWVPDYTDNCAIDPTTEEQICWHSGVARSLTPIVTEAVCGMCESEWDYLTFGLDEEVSFTMLPQVLKVCGCLTPDTNTKLFAIDETSYDECDGEEGTVWTFEDCYAKKAVELTSPAEGFVVGASACGCCNAPFNINWDRLCDACCYEIQFALDADFTQPYVPTDINGGDSVPTFSDYCPGVEVGSAAAANPTAFLGCGFQPETTYYWRVRTLQAGTGQEIHSWWSDARSFTVAPTAAAGTINMVSPVPGATNIATTNVPFSWTIQAPATSFTFVLSKSADLSSPILSKTGLTGTATTYTGTALTYDTPYYWQVTAYKDGSAISKSAVGTFRTAVQGSFCSAIDGQCFATQAELNTHNAELQAKTAPTPFWVWVVIGIGAVLVIVVIVLIFRTRRV